MNAILMIKYMKVCVIYKGDLAIKNLNYHILCNFHNWLIPYINLIGVITFSVTWYLILWVHVYVWNILYVFPYGSLETFNLNKCNVSLDISGDVYQFTKDVAKVDMWLCTSISNWDAIFEYKMFLCWNTSHDMYTPSWISWSYVYIFFLKIKYQKIFYEPNRMQ